MDKVITIEEPGVELNNFLAMEPGPYKNFLYFNEIQGKNFRRVNLSWKDDTLYYSYQDLAIRRNGAMFYVRQRDKAGFTFENKKLKIWWGKNIQSLPYLPMVISKLKMEWCCHKYYKFLTKGIFEKMLRGDITNPIDFCKAYLKAVRIKNVSPKLFNDMILADKVNRYDMFTAFEVAKDPNHFIERTLDDKYFNLLATDLVRQAIILGRKVDFMWSEKRMKAEHDAWTKEIMNMEGENIDDKPLNYLKQFELLDGMTLLDSQKKVWMEGKMMQHCVYTNYWSSIKNGTYNAYHIDIDGEQATLGINTWSDGQITFNQMYGHRNSNVSDKLLNTIKEWVNNISKPINQLTEL